MIDDQLSGCRIAGQVGGSNEQLNLNQPLQLGGVSLVDNADVIAKGLVTESIVGCVRDLTINGEVCITNILPLGFS